MKEAKGFIWLLVLVVVFCGVGAAYNFIKNAFSSVWMIFSTSFPKLIPFMGLEDKIISIIIVTVIIILSGVGMYISKKMEKKIGVIISGIVGLVSTILFWVGV